jgi:putative nucleotidyltransferase with HDIG domain
LKTGIIFVDDEVKVLDGIKRTLRGMRDQWEMKFATGAREALDIMSKEPIDVVVSDMRMPEFDGAQLLTEIKNKYPGVIRIVLTGSTEKRDVMQSLKVAHQFLSKPCEVENLKSAILSTYATKGLLENDTIKKAISSMGTLPSIPSLYMELVKEIESADASIHKVGKIISQDVSMTAKILQLVNSPYFGLYQRVASPEQASTLLGLETVKSLVLSVKIFAQYKNTKMPGFSPEELYSHSLATASVAKAIAKKEGEEEAFINDTFTAGMLHDLGKLILASNFPEQYQKTVAMASDNKVELWKAEKDVFNATHSEVGAYLLGIWGLPNSIMEAIAFHHYPEKYPKILFGPITAVYAANILEHASRTNGDGAQIDPEYLSRLNMEDRPDKWKEISSKILEGGEN